eukprot:6941620-Pyramimonas_sp.AAC.1
MPITEDWKGTWEQHGTWTAEFASMRPTPPFKVRSSPPRRGGGSEPVRVTPSGLLTERCLVDI